MLKSLESRSAEAEEAAPRRRTSYGALLAKGGAQFALMVAIIAGSVLAMNHLIATKPEKPSRPPFKSIYPVETAVLSVGDHVPQVLVYGQVVSERSVDLRALSPGEIVWVNDTLQAGAQAGKGEELVRIDKFSYEGALREARANLAQTEASIREINARLVSENDQLRAARDQLALAETDLQRATQLQQSGSLTTKQLEERQLSRSVREQAVLLRESNIAIAKAQLEQQQAARERQEWKVEQAQKALDDTVLRAPFSGIVRSSFAEIGRMAGASDALVSLYSLNELAARFTLTDAQFGRLSTDTDPLIGRAIEAYWSVGQTEYKVNGEITRIGADIDSARGGVEIYATLFQDTLPQQIRPGAFLEIRLPDRTYHNAARVPEDAVYSSDTIYVVADGELASRKVSVLAYDVGDAIISGDFKDGEMILATRLSVASNGLSVEPMESSLSGQNGDAGKN